jgi:hypothetical protein
MRSFDEYQMAGKDPDWDELRRVWGSGKKQVNSSLVSAFRMKVEQFKERMIQKMSKQQGREEMRSFHDVPIAEKDQMAQALVVAVLTSFYDTGSSTSFDPTKREMPFANRSGDTPNTPNAAPMPKPGGMEEAPAEAPEGWTGS